MIIWRCQAVQILDHGRKEPQMIEPLLTVEEAATHLRIKPSTIRRWIFDRSIEVVHIGRAVRIPTRVVEEIIRDGTRKAISL